MTYHDPTDELRLNLAEVRTHITQAAGRVGRDPHAVQLVAASKTVPVERLRHAIGLGQRVFGENRVQEAKEKWPTLRAETAEIELHLIGPLQSNKARDAVALFDVIQSVDRPSLVRALAKEARKQERAPRLYIQVNISAEPQKSGIAPDHLGALLEECVALGLTVTGLMCIPPVECDPTDEFDRLRELASQYDLPDVSMGMSGDYECAIERGATHVRVGSAIFGARPQVVK